MFIIAVLPLVTGRVWGHVQRTCTTTAVFSGRKKKTLCRDEKSIGRPGLPHPSHSETYVRLCTGRYVQCALFYVYTARGERTFHTCYGRIYTAEGRSITAEEMCRHRNGRGRLSTRREHFVERRNFYSKITRLNAVGTRCRIRFDLLGQKLYLKLPSIFSYKNAGNTYVFDCISFAFRAIRSSAILIPAIVLCAFNRLTLFVTLKQRNFRVTVFYSNLHRDIMLRNRTLMPVCV